MYIFKKIRSEDLGATCQKRTENFFKKKGNRVQPHGYTVFKIQKNSIAGWLYYYIYIYIDPPKA